MVLTKIDIENIIKLIEIRNKECNRSITNCKVKNRSDWISGSNNLRDFLISSLRSVKSNKYIKITDLIKE